MSTGVVLVFLLSAVIADGTALVVTDCEACSVDATCQSPSAGASDMTSTCSCMAGFAGDGVACYNRTACEGAACCSPGFHWSSELGCVDVDECASPSACTSPLECENTPGSFGCRMSQAGKVQESNGNPSAAPDSVPDSSPDSDPGSDSTPDERSVSFGCTGVTCPAGQDCLLVNGVRQCLDPCDHYTVLNDQWRATNYQVSNAAACDRNGDWQGWYRLFLGNASVQMPERCVDANLCGAHAPLWLPERHPELSDGIVSSRVCGKWNHDCCWFDSNRIHVKACPRNYFVYKFVDPSACSLAYCADVRTAVCGTCGADETCVSEDKVSWRCERPSSAQIRLVNGDDQCSGRVEIYHSGQWGTVCDDIWNMNNAEVVCRQAGCGSALSAESSAHFGPGSGPIWLDNVWCNGNESSLTQCQHRGFGSHDCSHHEDAGVVCSSNAQIRLVNGDHQCAGRVEIYHDGQWGTVCDDFWDMDNAKVVCREVGCGRAVAAPDFAHFGQGRGPIWMDDVFCTGNESSLKQCRHPGFGVHNCAHAEDAGVICEEIDPPLELDCQRNFMRVGISRDYLEGRGLDPSSTHLAHFRCSGHSEHNGILWFVVWHRSPCGTQKRMNGTHTIYSNSLFVYPASRNFSIPNRFPFTCIYPLESEASLDATVIPYLLTEGEIVGVGPGPSSYMTLYRSSDYTDSYMPGAVILPLGAPLYVGVVVPEAGLEGFAVILEECYSTITSDANHPSRYNLITGRCSAHSRLVKVEPSGPSLPGRFTVLVNLFSGDYDHIFLHCNLRVCDPNRYGCSQTCRSRVSRSTSRGKLVTIGPISWENTPRVEGPASAGA